MSADLPAEASTRVAAFFDLDKTIVATSSAFAFGRTLIAHGMLSTKDALALVLAETGYMLTGHSEQQMDDAKNQITQMIKGMRVEDLKEALEHTLELRVVPAIFSEARALIDDHLNQGHDVIIISASVAELVEPIAEELGATHTLTTLLDVHEGTYTGELLFYCRGDAKAEGIRRLAMQHGYNLADSFAYSDSATDIPMLEAVGHPHAVNPDRALKKHAQEHDWPVLNFKNPVPLVPAPSKKDVGIGSAIAAVVALGVGSWWATSRWLKNER